MKRPLASALAAALLAATSMTAPPLAPEAHAITVIDPSNLAQNVIQAARALEQVKNQIESLANEARMLARLDLQLAPELTQSIQAARDLLDQARGIRQNIDTIVEEMRTLYPEDLRDLDLETLLTQSDRWLAESRAATENLAQIGAAGVRGLGDAQSGMNRALQASAGAEGQTAAMQATTQAIGVLSVQLAELQALQAAQARALAAERLERIAREERAREIRRRAFPTDNASNATPATPRF
jgi:P-type conjugative transfer protein TrbJ